MISAQFLTCKVLCLFGCGSPSLSVSLSVYILLMLYCIDTFFSESLQDAGKGKGEGVGGVVGESNGATASTGGNHRWRGLPTDGPHHRCATGSHRWEIFSTALQEQEFH